jgi:hypothetical protein
VAKNRRALGGRRALSVAISPSWSESHVKTLSSL